MNVSLFDQTGRFVQILSGSIEFVINPTLEYTNHHCVNGEFDDTYQWAGGQAIKRPPCPAVLVDGALSNLPTPCKIQIDGEVYDCEDSTAELSFDQPGAYNIQVFAFPYLTGEYSHHEN